MSSVYEDGLISEVAYSDSESARSELEELGWESLGAATDHLRDHELDFALNNGFHAEAFLGPSGEVVIGFRGTEFGLNREAIADLGSDVDLALAINPLQTESARQFTRSVIEEFEMSQVHLTGHSLGGFLAQEIKYWLDSNENPVGVSRDVQSTGTGFNSPGMGWVNDDLTDGKFLHINDTGDIVRFGGWERLGETLVVDGPGDIGINPFGAHGIDGLIEFMATRSWAQASSEEILGFPEEVIHAIESSGSIEEHVSHLDSLADTAHQRLALVEEKMASLADEAGSYTVTRLSIEQASLKHYLGRLSSDRADLKEFLQSQSVQKAFDETPGPHSVFETSGVDPLLNDGSLNPAFLNSFNNADTSSEFLRANAGLQLADAGSGVLQREYAAFVYNKALVEAATRTGRDVAEILDLDVPGNPNAAGWNYQRPGQQLDAETVEGLAAFLDTDAATVRAWADRGELAEQYAARQSEQLADTARFLEASEQRVQALQAQGELQAAIDDKRIELEQGAGIQSSIHGLNALVEGLDDGGVLDIVSGLGQLGLGVDRLQDSFEAGSGILSESAAAGMTAGVSAANLVDDIAQGDELGAVTSGVYFLDDFGTAADIEGLASLNELSGVSEGLGALSLYNALDSGDAASIGRAGFQLADTVTNQAMTQSLNNVTGLSGTNVPYASYITAGLQLIEGNEEQAALSAVSGYLMTMGPYGIAAGALLSVFGGSLIGSEPPNAWADFKLNGDGSFGLDIDSNDTGGGLEEAAAQYGQRLTPLLDQVRAEGVEVKQDYLPRLGIKDDEVYIERAGATHKLGKMGEPMPELAVQFQMGVVLDWMVDNGLRQWNRSGRLKYLGDTDWSHSVRGTGVFAGGGQQQYAPVTIDGKRIVSLNDPALRPVSQQLAEVTRTWRLDKSLFAGDRGGLLAVGLGAGAVQYLSDARISPN